MKTAILYLYLYLYYIILYLYYITLYYLYCAISASSALSARLHPFQYATEHGQFSVDCRVDHCEEATNGDESDDHAPGPRERRHCGPQEALTQEAGSHTTAAQRDTGEGNTDQEGPDLRRVLLWLLPLRCEVLVLRQAVRH